MAERTAKPTRKNNAADLMRLNVINSKSLPFGDMLLNNAFFDKGHKYHFVVFL